MQLFSWFLGRFLALVVSVTITVTVGFLAGLACHYLNY
jgi:hypothetical protein